MLQRSGDMFLGVPFNIFSTTLLTIFMSRAAGMLPGTINITISDAHIYKNHIDQVKEQLTRTPYQFPIIKLDAKISSLKDMRALKYSSVEIKEYNKWPAIKADMAV
jgi:thymidylate synthase